MTSKKTPKTIKKPAFSATFNHALHVLNSTNPMGVAEVQTTYTPPPLPPKKPVKGDKEAE
jgi:hypothetical protein